MFLLLPWSVSDGRRKRLLPNPVGWTTIEHTLIPTEGASNGLPVQAVTESGLYSLILGSRKPEAAAIQADGSPRSAAGHPETGSFAVNMSPAEHLLARHRCLWNRNAGSVNWSRARDAIEHRMRVVEARQAEGAPDFYSVLAVLQSPRFRLDLTRAIAWGRRASVVSRSIGVPSVASGPAFRPGQHVPHRCPGRGRPRAGLIMDEEVA